MGGAAADSDKGREERACGRSVRSCPHCCMYDGHTASPSSMGVLARELDSVYVPFNPLPNNSGVGKQRDDAMPDHKERKSP